MGRNGFSIGVMAVALALGACGVKSSPRFPEGSVYPSKYPYADTKQGATAPTPSAASSSPGAPDKIRESDRDRRSPLGFPLEYPNRSSY